MGLEDARPEVAPVTQELPSMGEINAFNTMHIEDLASI